MDAEKKLQIAKIYLLTKHPFFGSLLASLPYQIDEETKTAGTDGNIIHFNRGFIDGLKKDNLVFLTAHEIMHVALETAYRLGNRNRELWNVAADYVINGILVEDKVGNMLKDGMYNKEYGGMSAEEVYAILYKKTKNIHKGAIELSDEQRKKLADALSVSIEDLEESKLWVKAKRNDTLPEKLNDARNFEKEVGTTSLASKTVLGEIRTPMLAWQDVLNSYITNDKRRTSYKRFNRKYINDGIYLPTAHSEKLELAVILDVSGSISDEDLKHFLGEVLAIINMRLDEKVIRILQTDTAVLYDKIYEDGDNIDMRYGSGGTDFHSVFKRVEGTEVVILFTDGIASIPEKKPDFELITITTANSLPYGINIKYEGGV